MFLALTNDVVKHKGGKINVI